MAKVFMILGSVLGMLSVGMGAFGAHFMRARLDARMLEVWDTASEYQMFHALALLAVGLLCTRVDSAATSVAGWSFLVGVVLFSGSLYMMAFTGIKWLGAITPMGGVSFIIGWLALAIASAKLV